MIFKILTKKIFAYKKVGVRRREWVREIARVIVWEWEKECESKSEITNVLDIERDREIVSQRVSEWVKHYERVGKRVKEKFLRKTRFPQLKSSFSSNEMRPPSKEALCMVYNLHISLVHPCLSMSVGELLLCEITAPVPKCIVCKGFVVVQSDIADSTHTHTHKSIHPRLYFPSGGRHV